MRGELDWIVMKALEKDRNRRYESANGFADGPRSATWPMSRCRRARRRHGIGFGSLCGETNVPCVTAALLGGMLLVAGLFAYRRHWLQVQRRPTRPHMRNNSSPRSGRMPLEKALLGAMSGDFDGAEKAIAEAELLGASTGQVRMLRGQVAFHRGDLTVAIEHLEQAVKLLPDSVAARAGLILAYHESGQTARFDQLAPELDRLTPVTAEDYLFKGQLESLVNPERQLQTLEEALRRRPNSSIVLAVRLVARAERALFTDDPRDADLALQDASVVKTLLPGNPFALTRSVYAHLVAASVFASNGLKERSGRPWNRQGVM